MPQGKPKRLKVTAFETHDRDHARRAKHLRLFITRAAWLPTHYKWGPGPLVSGIGLPEAFGTTRKVSPHSHDSKGTTKPSIFNAMIQKNQCHNVTRHVGHKAAKELLSLIPLFIYPFVVFVSILINQVS
jgi:hypothetical protein